MKQFKIALIAAASCAAIASAHPPDAFDAASSRAWTNARTGERIEGSFMFARSGKVAIATRDGGLATVALADLAGDDRAAADGRIAEVRAINESLVANAASTPVAQATPARGKPPGGDAKTDAKTDAKSDAKPAQAATFDKFAPFVKTRADERWLYVESDGLPHEPLEFTPMVGIRAWQQQVPLPQNYTGANAWQIPLKPQLADKPVSGKNAMMRGAMALAANGIPIFNALNNRGVDSYSIGELDEYGGHCGRADDYHYHAAPLAIEKIVGKGNPIAYALDGLAIYGLYDPKAKAGGDLACPLGATDPLDELNGHFCAVPKGQGFGGGTQSYHYHASKTFPYINGGMRGKVTLSGQGNESEVTPQAHANPMRPALQALRGAKITEFERVTETSWSLRYQVDGKTSRIDYRLESGKVIFDFIAPDGTKRTEEYSPRARGGQDGPPGGEPPGGGQRGGGQRGGGQRGGRGGDQPPPPRDANRDRPRDRGADAPKSGFMLQSSGVLPSGLLDAKYTCDGDSISPPLAWRGIPEGTKSLALSMHHIPPDGGEHVYMVIWDIPAATTDLDAGEHGIGSWGVNTVNRRAEYAPPCSKGPGEKEYIVTLFALSEAPKLAKGATRAQLLEAIKASTLGTAELTLRYARPDGSGAAARGGGGGGGRGGERGGERGGDRGGERGGDTGLLDRMTAFRTDVPTQPMNVVLARASDRAVTVSVGLAKAGDALVEYWTDKAPRTQQSKPVKIEAGKVGFIDVEGLQPGTEYTYRVGVAYPGDKSAQWNAESSFRTRAAAGTPFAFAIQADSHLDANMQPKVYEQTLRNIHESKAEFLVDLGDTFMTDKRGQDYERALPQYDAQRYYFGLACDAKPLFMVLGNHDGEKGDAGRGIAEWSYNQRIARFPAPKIDGKSFTGATAMKDGRGANYYAFEWGDALFVVLDPFWPTTERARGGGGGGGDGPRGGPDGPRGGGAGGGPNVEKLSPQDSSWSRTLGRAQYDWLAETLAKSKAKQKFVFIHHLVGGIGGQAARGGVESAPFFEWGGKNADGTDGFAARRPGWPMPIHQLLVKHGVSAIFHGHDHLYVHSSLDGVQYQCVPQPGNLAGGTRSADEYGYASGKILGSPGHVRVSVAADGTAKVEFVRTAIDGDARESNGTIVDNYEIKPRAARPDLK